MSKKVKNLNSKKFFNILVFNHVIVVLIMMILGIFNYIFSNFDIEELGLENLINDITPLIFISGIYISHHLYSKSIKRLQKLSLNEYIVSKNISEKNQLIFKMSSYRMALITRYFFIIIPIIITPLIIDIDVLYFLCLGLSIFYSFTIIPSKKRAIKDMELKDNEIQRINNPQAVIARKTFSMGANNVSQWRY